MATHELNEHPSRRYGHPARDDVFPIIIVGVALGLCFGALGWAWGLGGLSWLGAIGGTTVGLLVVVAWSLRDGLLQGEPRFELSRRISFSFLAAGLILEGALWSGGPEVARSSVMTASIVFLAWLLFVVVGTASVNREVESQIISIGTGRAGRALIVYHSARGGLMRAMQVAFADGMQAEGWQLDLCTASHLSPVDLSGYQLLVLGTPCYNRGLARPMSAYLNHLGDLKGIRVVIVVTGFNYTERATQTLRDRVQQAHGQVVDEIELWTGRPNVAHDGTTDPPEIMRRAGTRLGGTIRSAAA